MKLKKLDSFESLNSQELKYVVGGTCINMTQEVVVKSTMKLL